MRSRRRRVLLIQHHQAFQTRTTSSHMICYKCVESNPWIKKYAGGPGFLPPVFRNDHQAAAKDESKPTIVDTASSSNSIAPVSLKRKASDGDLDARPSSPSKRVKDEMSISPEQPPALTRLAEPPAEAIDATASNGDRVTVPPKPQHKHDFLRPTPPTGVLSLFLRPSFRDHLCHCPACYPNLIPHPHLLDEEETYEPSLSSGGTASPSRRRGPRCTQCTLLAPHQFKRRLSLRPRPKLPRTPPVDRVRAIEGVMVYNHLRDKVKEFLKPYAENGKVVSAEDIKAYFEKLRGDEGAIEEQRARADENPGEGDGDGDNRREQSGY